MRLSGFLLVGLCGIAVGSDGETFHNDPISTYEQCRIAGFTVLVNPRLHEHPLDGGAAMDELNHQLINVARVVPPAVLARLRKVSIYVEWAETPGLGEFHPDDRTLIEQHRNPRKAHAVEIVNARHLVEWASIQPWSILHELAHSYHFLVLGQDNRAVTQAFDLAMASRKYDKVEFASGGTRPAYALKNRFEYFAELTEAYFGKNDFEPTNKVELAQFDPTGYKLMKEIWGTPVD